MWARLDDALIDHRKVSAAGRHIGSNGRVIAIGFYAVALMWSNKHLTDGFIPEDVIEGFNHADSPTSVADALVQAGLFDRTVGGFQIHDFTEWNPIAAKVKKKREADRARKAANGNGNGNGHA